MPARRRAPLLLPLAVGLLVGAGCSDDDVGAGSGGSGGSGGAVVTAPPLPAGDAIPDAPARRIVSPTTGLLDPIPTFVESYATPAPSTLELRFTTGVEACYGLDRVDVVEAADTVTVTVLTGRKPGADVCIELAELVATSVELAAPLAARAVLDGSSGEPIPVD